MVRKQITPRGYLGEFTVTDRPCPQCQIEGIKNNGGTTPTLRQAANGSLHCMGRHGQVSAPDAR